MQLYRALSSKLVYINAYAHASSIDVLMIESSAPIPYAEPASCPSFSWYYLFSGAKL